jgi:hypothetical protein
MVYSYTTTDLFSMGDMYSYSGVFTVKATPSDFDISTSVTIYDLNIAGLASVGECGTTTSISDLPSISDFTYYLGD